MELVRPAAEYQGTFMGALAEFLNAESNDRRTRYEQSAAEINEHGFDGYVRIECSRALGENLPDGFVPETTRWLIDDGVYIGRVNIRHELNDHLLKEGGHVGYDVRPSKRMQGYGSAMLELAIPKVRELGIDRILLTCNASNVGSRKIIEKNGGVLENEVIDTEKGTHKLRFWIEK